MEGGGKRSEQSVTWTGRRRCGDRETESNRRRKRKENNELRVTSLSRSPLSLAHRPPARPSARVAVAATSTPPTREAGGSGRGGGEVAHVELRLASMPGGVWRTHSVERPACCASRKFPGAWGWRWAAGDWREAEGREDGSGVTGDG